MFRRGASATAGPEIADLVSHVLYECTLRAQASSPDLYGTVPGLASLYVETLPRGLAGGRSPARPVLAIWGSVLMQRLLEVLGDALSTADADARPRVFETQASPPQVSQALARIFCHDFPSAAPPFLLQCIGSQQALEWLLGDERRLAVRAVGLAVCALALTRTPRPACRLSTCPRRGTSRLRATSAPPPHATLG